MEIEKIFKNIVMLDFAFLILIAINSMYQPVEIINLNKNLNDGYLSNYNNFLGIVGLILFFVYLFTLNLLYRFVSYGKPLYLFIIIAGIALNYLNGSIIYTPFSSLLDQIGGILSGALLILLYYSPIKNNFTKK